MVLTMSSESTLAQPIVFSDKGVYFTAHMQTCGHQHDVTYARMLCLGRWARPGCNARRRRLAIRSTATTDYDSLLCLPQAPSSAAISACSTTAWAWSLPPADRYPCRARPFLTPAAAACARRHRDVCARRHLWLWRVPGATGRPRLLLRPVPRLVPRLEPLQAADDHLLLRLSRATDSPAAPPPAGSTVLWATHARACVRLAHTGE